MAGGISETISGDKGEEGEGEERGVTGLAACDEEIGDGLGDAGDMLEAKPSSSSSSSKTTQERSIGARAALLKAIIQ